MADYKLMAAGGVIHQPTATFIPPSAGNRGYQAYQEWVDEGNTADPADTESLASIRARYVRLLNLQANVEREKWLPPSGASAIWFLEQLAEARAASVDGSITGGEYPLLEARITEKGADVAAVATAILSDFDTIKAGLAAIEAVRSPAEAAVNAASDEAGCKSAVDAVVWP